ncbi:anthrax toxin receptor-like [Mustela erminea]|uniref:anthrax toxin receptor-like n=1 Tax=Mustela erminea TaxID=36723 RepID=UPI001386E8F4|nr:anthrax toxin receptor-like [Mustela erminea]
MRMSFITYSTQGHTLMELTSDRNEISDGLTKLQNIVPTGATNMQEGLKKANEQIEQENAKEEYAVTFYDTALDLYTKDEIVCRYKLEFKAAFSTVSSPNVASK